LKRAIPIADEIPGAWSHGNASRNCCAVHAAVGCSVTAVCTTRRRS
jgi:hypothetical protein